MVTNANDIFVMNLEKNVDKKEIIIIIINMKKREHTRLAAYDEAIYSILGKGHWIFGSEPLYAMCFTIWTKSVF